ISAFSCHNNPVSPDPEEARIADETLRKTLLLASLCNVEVVNTFSGTPGDHENAKYPNWPVATWPTVYRDIYQWQWEKKLIPYWKEIGKLAEKLHVKIAIELHGGFSCHTPHTILKLRQNTSKNIGVNFDPSHLWWQGIDPVAAIKILGKEKAIFHFHAKDTYLDQEAINMYGLTDMQSYGEIQTRSWNFRTVGHGHSMFDWAKMLDTLRIYGYDHVISIEHEDPIMTIDEGFHKAVSNLKTILISDKLDHMWWI
ncbi:MAG: sugar phosphate isomerase/epimerase, partial [Acholeplasmataceae bacterium]|nr:sugar phosphate isomerase/epimerase [Acholeplasmataceae bacterium]